MSLVADELPAPIEEISTEDEELSQQLLLSSFLPLSIAGDEGIMVINNTTIDLSGSSYTITNGQIAPGEAGETKTFDSTDTLNFTGTGAVTATLSGQGITVAGLKVGSNGSLTVSGGVGMSVTGGSTLGAGASLTVSGNDTTLSFGNTLQLENAASAGSSSGVGLTVSGGNSGTKLNIAENLFIGSSGTITVSGGELHAKKRVCGNGGNFTGAISVTGGGLLEIGEAGTAGNVAQGSNSDNDGWLGNITVSGANSRMKVHGSVGTNANTTITVKEGGSLEVGGNIAYTFAYNGSIGALAIGSSGEDGSTSNGTVTAGLNVYAASVTVAGSSSQLKVGGLLELKSSGQSGTTGSGNTLSISGGSVILNGGLTAYSVSLTGGALTMSGEVSAASGISVSNGSLKVTGELTATEGQTWTISNSGVFEVTDGTTLSVTPSGSEKKLKLVVDAQSTSGKLKMSTAELTALTHHCKIALSLSNYTYGTSGSITLFDINDQDATEEWKAAAKRFLDVAMDGGEHYVATFGTGGAVTIAEGHDLTWQAGVDTWQNGVGSWSTGGAGTSTFNNGDSVTFADDTTPGTTHAITISGTVAPWEMTVSRGQFSFTGGTLNASLLSLADGSTTTFTNTTITLNGDAATAGTVTSGKTAAKLVLKGSSSLFLSYAEISDEDGTDAVEMLKNVVIWDSAVNISLLGEVGGNAMYTVRGLEGGSGSIQIKGNGPFAQDSNRYYATFVIETQAGDNFASDVIIKDAAPGSQKKLRLLKKGAGSQTLSGNEMDARAIQVEGGTLILSGSNLWTNIFSVDGQHSVRKFASGAAKAGGAGAMQLTLTGGGQAVFDVAWTINAVNVVDEGNGIELGKNTTPTITVSSGFIFGNSTGQIKLTGAGTVTVTGAVGLGTSENKGNIYIGEGVTLSLTGVTAAQESYALFSGSGTLEIAAGKVLNVRTPDPPSGTTEDQHVVVKLDSSESGFHIKGEGTITIGGIEGAGGSIMPQTADATLVLDVLEEKEYTTDAHIDSITVTEGETQNTYRLTVTKKGEGKQTIGGAVDVAKVTVERGELELGRNLQVYANDATNVDAIIISDGGVLSVGGDVSRTGTTQTGAVKLGGNGDGNYGTLTVGGGAYLGSLTITGSESGAEFGANLAVGALKMNGGTLSVVGDYSTGAALNIYGGATATLGSLLASGQSGQSGQSVFTGAVTVGGMGGSTGTLTVGASENQSYANATNNVDAWVNKLTVQGHGSRVRIEGSLAMHTTGNTALSITGGSSVEVGYAIGGDNGFNAKNGARDWTLSGATGDLIIGATGNSGNTTGRLDVGGGIKARNVTVQGANGEEGEGSSLEVVLGIDLTGSLTVTGAGNKAKLSGSIRTVGGINVTEGGVLELVEGAVVDGDGTQIISATDGGVLRLTGATTVNVAQRWTIGAEAGKLDISGDFLSVAEGGSLRIMVNVAKDGEGDVSAGGKLRLTNEAMTALEGLAGKIELELAPFVDTYASWKRWECDLFDVSDLSDWNADVAKSMLLALMGVYNEDDLTVDEKGHVSYTVESHELTWAGPEGGGGTWVANGEEKVWTIEKGGESAVFHNNDQVTFTGGVGEAGDITVSGKVVAGTMVVHGGGVQGNWNFNGTGADEDSLALPGGLTVYGNDAHVTFGDQLTMSLREITFEGTSAGNGGRVTFDGTQVTLSSSEHKISGVGTVEVTGAAGLTWKGDTNLVVGDGSGKTVLNVGGDATVGENSYRVGLLTVKDGSEVTFSSSQNLYLTGIRVENGGKVTLDGAGGVALRGEHGVQIETGGEVEILSYNNGACPNFWAYGEGTLKINTGTALGMLVGGQSRPASLSGKTLSRLVLCGSSSVVFESSGSHSNFHHVTEYIVEEGSALAFGAGIMDGAGAITVHVAGYGREKREGETGSLAETSSYAALGLYNYSGWINESQHASTNCNFKVVLDNNASLGVGNNNAGTAPIGVKMQGSIDFGGRTLTKVGYGTLFLNDGFQVTNGNTGGTIDVTNGTVTLGNSTNASTLQNIDIKLSESEVNGAAVSGKLQVNQNVSVGALYGSGNVSVATNRVLTLVKAATDGQIFTGTMGADGIGTVRVQNGGSFLLGSGADVGNTLEILGTLSTARDSTEMSVATLRVGTGGTVTLAEGSEMSVATLRVGTGGTVTLAEGSEMSVGGMDGIVASGTTGYGSISGEGRLILTAGSGKFEGSVSSKFTYDGGSSGQFRLDGGFSSKALTVQSGKLILGSELSPEGGSEWTVGSSGVLELKYAPSLTVQGEGKLSLVVEVAETCGKLGLGLDQLNQLIPGGKVALDLPGYSLGTQIALFDVSGLTPDTEWTTVAQNFLTAALADSMRVQDVTVTTEGLVTINSQNAYNLYWAQGVETWQTGREEKDWKDGGPTASNTSAFFAGDNVFFEDAATPAGRHEVTISGTVGPGKVTVSSGTFAFTGGVVNAVSLSLADGSSATFSGTAITLSGTGATEGTVTTGKAAAELVLGGGSSLTLDYAEAGGSAAAGMLKNVVIKGGVTVEGDDQPSYRIYLKGAGEEGPEATYILRGLEGDGGEIGISTSENRATLVLETKGATEEFSSGVVFGEGAANIKLVKRGEGTQTLTNSTISVGEIHAEGGTLKFTAEDAENGTSEADFTVEKGGQVVFTKVWYFGNKEVHISGEGSAMTLEGAMRGGRGDYTGSVTVKAGGKLNLNAEIGTEIASKNAVQDLTISGEGSAVTVTSHLGVKENGAEKAAITITDGGSLRVGGILSRSDQGNVQTGMIILGGEGEGNDGTLNVEGTARFSSLVIAGSGSKATFGEQIYCGSVTAQGGSLTVEGLASVSGTLSVDGAGTDVHLKNRLSNGTGGYSGSLSVTGGGSLTIGEGGNSENPTQGGNSDNDAWVTGTTVSGEGSSLTIYGSLVNKNEADKAVNVTEGGTLKVGGSIAGTNNYNNQGIAELNIGVAINEEGEEVTSSGTVKVGKNAYAGSVRVRGAGSVLEVGQRLAGDGGNFTGKLTVGAGGSVEVGKQYEEELDSGTNGDIWCTGLSVDGGGSLVTIHGGLANNSEQDIEVTHGGRLVVEKAVAAHNSYADYTGNVIIGGEDVGNYGVVEVGDKLNVASVAVHGTESSLRVDGLLDLNNGETEANALTISAGSVTLAGGMKAYSAELTGGELSMSGEVSVANGRISATEGSLKVGAGELTTIGVQEWTIGEGARLEMTEEGSSLAVAEGGSLHIFVSTGERGGKLRLSDAAMGQLGTLGERVRLTLENFSPVQSWEYALFDTGAPAWNAEAALSMLTELMGEVAAGLKLEVDNNGVVRYAYDPHILTWDGVPGGTWSNAALNPDNKPWKRRRSDEPVAFFAYDSVFFLGGQGEGAIIVDGYNRVGSMNVSGGAGWSFNGDGEGTDLLLLTEGLHLTGSETRVSFGENLTVRVDGITFQEGGSEAKVTFDGTQVELLPGEEKGASGIFSISGAGEVEFTETASVTAEAGSFEMEVGDGTQKTVLLYAGKGNLELSRLEVAAGSEVTIANGGSFSLESGLELTGGAKVTLGAESGVVVDGEVKIAGEGTVLTYAEGGYAFRQKEEMTVGAGATLVVANSGLKDFTGGIQVDEGGVVELRNFGNQRNLWVHGEGTLKLATGTALDGLGGSNFVLISGEGLAHMVLCDSTALVFGTKDNGEGDHFAAAKEYTVEAGSALAFGADVMNRAGVTVRVSGTGREKREGETDALTETASYAALGLYNSSRWTDANGHETANCGFQVILDDDASLGVGNNAARTAGICVRMQGSIDFGGHTLTKVGYGELRLSGNFLVPEEEGGGAGKGVIDVTNGKLTLACTGNPDTLQNIDIRLSESTVGEAAVHGALQVVENARIGTLTGSGEAAIAAEKALSVAGKVDAGRTAFSLGRGSRLVLESTGANAMGSLTLEGDGAGLQLDVGGASEDIAALTLGEVNFNRNVLTLTVTGVAEYLASHDVGDVDRGWVIHLFGGGAEGQLFEMFDSGKLLLSDIEGYDAELNAQGQLTLTREDSLIWTDTRHEGPRQLTWENGVGGWDNGGTFLNGKSARLVSSGSTSVTVNGAVEAKKVVITGQGPYTFSSGEEGSLRVEELNVQTSSNFGVCVALEGSMVVGDGKTVGFTEQLTGEGGGNITLALGNGATLRLQGDNLLSIAEGTSVQMSGSGAFEVDLSGAAGYGFNGANLAVSEGVQVRIKSTNEAGGALSEVDNLNAPGEVEVEGRQLMLGGKENTIGNIIAKTSEGDEWNGCSLRLVNSGAATTITGDGELNLENGCLEVRSGSFEKQAGKLVIGGLRSPDGGNGTVRVKDLEIVADDAWVFNEQGEGASAERRYSGSLVVGGNFVMRGEDGREQYISGNTLSVGGNLDILSGALRMGSAGRSMSVGGDLRVQQGRFAWEGGEFTMGTLSVSGGGEATFAAGATTVEGGLTVGEGSTLCVSNNATFRATEGGVCGGVLKLDGGELVVATEKSLTVSSIMSGTTAGRVRLEDGARMSIAAGTLSAKGFEIGAGAELTLVGSSVSMVGANSWDWGSGAQLTLDCSGTGSLARLSLGEGFSFGPGAGEENRLTINVTAEYMDTLTGGKEGTSAVFLGGENWQEGRGWENYFDVELKGISWKYIDLHINEHGNLEWLGRQGVEWSGNSDSWRDDSSAGWRDAESGGKAEEPAGQNVYFTAEKADPAGSDVKVQGTVTPDNVFVEGGEYSFTNGGGEGGGLAMQDKGMLVVEKGAELNLNLKNTKIPTVIVEGTLGIGHEEALPDGTDLQLLDGGTLRYAGRGAQDVSALVTEESIGNVLNVEVGEGAGEDKVKWGGESADASANNGLKMALDTGTKKTGAGGFTLAWQEKPQGGEHRGTMNVEEGSLTLEVKAPEAGTVSRMSGDARIEENAQLNLKAGGEGRLELAGKVTGGGTLNLQEGNITVSGENLAGNIRLAEGSRVTINNDHGLGGDGTTLKLDGGTIEAGGGGRMQVQAGTVEVNGDTTLSGNVTLTGALTQGEEAAGGTLKLAEGASGTLTGDLSAFTGTLETGEGADGVWTLSGKGVGGASGEVQADVTGGGMLMVASAERVTLTGELGTGSSDRLTVRNGGSGDLVIAGEVGAATVLNTGDPTNGAIVLGSGSRAVDMTGIEEEIAGSGRLVLANVTIGSDFRKGSASLYVDTAEAEESDGTAAYGLRARAAARGGVVDVQGMQAEEFAGITVNEHGLLTGVTGAYKVGVEHELELHFSAENSGEGGLALIEGGDDFTVERGDGSHVQLAFSEDVFDLFGGGERTVVFRALENGTWSGEELTLEALAGMEDTVAQVLGGILSSVRYTADGIEMVGTTRDVYLVNGKEGGDKATSTDVRDLLGRRATVLVSGQKLTLNWNASASGAASARVNNLLGTAGTELEINNTAEEDPTGRNRLNVALDNTYYETVNMEGHEGEELPEPDGTTVHGQDTSFRGSITGGKGVDITKTGKGTLSVGGNYRLADGTTSIRRGALALSGKENSMENLEFAYETGRDGAEGEKRGLELEGGKTTIRGAILEKEGSSGDGDAITLNKGAGLELGGESVLASTSITGDGSGTLTLAQEASLEFAGDGNETRLSGVGVRMGGEKTTLDVGSGVNDVTELVGNGLLKSGKGGELSVGGGSFSGTLASSADGGQAGGLVVQAGAEFALDNVKTTAGSRSEAWDVTVREGAGLTLNLTGTPEGEAVQFNRVTVEGRMYMGLDTTKTNEQAPVGGELTVGEKGELEVHSDGERVKETFFLGFTTQQAGDYLEERLTLSGSAFVLDDLLNVQVDEKGNIIVTTRKAQDNKFERTMPDAGKNGLAGAAMMWDSLKNKTQEGSLAEVLSNPDSDYAKLGMAVIGMMDGGDAAGLEKTLTAVSGASIATMAPAFLEDMHRQLRTIRNRTTTMGGEVNRDAAGQHRKLNAWINGEGSYHKLDADGYLPGYTLNSWGGTVGVDVEVAQRTTLGLALTAMYGDLKPDAVDSATGHMDTTYLSVFLKAMSGSWIHTLVLSGGMADIDMERTVNYGVGSYRTKGNTDGSAFGALYEVGYTRLMNKEGTFALQPVFNVEVRHASINGYDETGSDAGLSVDDMQQDSITFGAGARMQSVVGERALNRTSIFEARLLVKADVGDRSGTATNGIVDANATAEVEGAEVGALGVEVGVGLTVPLGATAGSVFLDASLEYRRGWTSADASIGYRINF